MTKYIDSEKLKVRLRTSIELLRMGEPTNEITRIVGERHIETYGKLLEFIESIEQELSLPSNLDEAAEEALDNYDSEFYNTDDDGSSEPLFDMQQMLAMFKAGAEWMAGQGWSRELEVKEDAGGYPYIDKHIELYDYDTNTPFAKKGDKVIVQIRKI